MAFCSLLSGQILVAGSMGRIQSLSDADLVRVVFA
jgi:hypothetical protein